MLYDVTVHASVSAVAGNPGRSALGDRLVCEVRVARDLVRRPSRPLLLFFFNDTATTEIYTLSLHDALPISLPPRPSALRLMRPLRRHRPSWTSRPRHPYPLGRWGPPTPRLWLRREGRRPTEIGRAHV